MMLSLAIFEPLLCIVSCQFWMSFAIGNVSVQHQHHHQHMHADAASMAPVPTPVHAADAVIVHEAASVAGCTMHIGYPSGSPMPPPPSPIHETLPTLVLPLFILLLVVMYRSSPLTGPPRVFVAVPLRPPIPIAG
jgi:hypothetical protein